MKRLLITKNTEALDNYGECCKKMKACYYLAKKWEITGKTKLLEEIVKECEQIYNVEKGKLGLMYKLAKDYVKGGF